MKKVDKLSFKVCTDQRKAYKNISKYKLVLTTVVDSTIEVYVNDRKIAEDEVFVVNEFVESLIKQGKYPMFTCTCGIFGCGGYYVDVKHKGQYLFWSMDQNPFDGVSSHHSFTFIQSDVIRAANKLILELEKLNYLLRENGLSLYYDTHYYKEIVSCIVVRNVELEGL